MNGYVILAAAPVAAGDVSAVRIVLRVKYVPYHMCVTPLSDEKTVQVKVTTFFIRPTLGCLKVSAYAFLCVRDGRLRCFCCTYLGLLLAGITKIHNVNMLKNNRDFRADPETTEASIDLHATKKWIWICNEQDTHAATQKDSGRRIPCLAIF